jgi:hypothetical protein
MIVILTNIALGISLAAMNSNDASNFINQLLMSNNGQKNASASVAIFLAFYLIGTMLPIFVIVHMCINNKRRCFIDHISDTVVIKLVDVSTDQSNASANAKPTKRKRNYGLPGEIIAGAENEIDSL